MALHIDGPQSGRLSDAIEDSFPNPMILQQVINYKLNDSIFNYAGFGAQYPEIRFNFISQYNARYAIDKLVLALLEQNPTNVKLLEFAWQHRLIGRPPNPDGKNTVSDGSLERMLDPVRGFKDPVDFLRRFGQIMKSVCRISVPSDQGIEYGSGFLIGDETVITNYHVMESLITKASGTDRRTVRFLFDYQNGPDGQTISQGVEYKLVDSDDAWLIDHSPYHHYDLVINPPSVNDNSNLDRPLDHLDYAILRLAGNPGKSRLGEKPTSDGEIRGHLSLPSSHNERDFEKDAAAVFIFQHPCGIPPEPTILPLRLDWEKPAILGVNKNLARVFYNVNTRKGSSGSPCCNAKLEPIALHHAGGKDWPASSQYLYNTGIPLTTIRALLESRNKIGEIR